MSRKTQWILLDNFKRKYYLKKEIKYLILKSLLKNHFNMLFIRYFFFILKIRSKQKYSIIQQNNKCVKTGRIKSLNKFTKYSRFIFRNEIYSGNLPGFKRASW